MLIGQDFEKIEFRFLGYDFLEPNALYGDTIVAILAVYCAVICARYYKQTQLIFFKHWKHFFYVFGIGFFLGGLGHFCYGYWGIPGKVPAWYISGISSAMFIELGMASLLPKERYKKLVPFFIIKTAIIWVIQALLIAFIDLEKEPGLGLIGPTLAMVTALPTSLGVLGYRFSKSITPKFKYLWWSLIVFSPSLLFQAMKINFHQWFDRNDVSHVLMFANITLYFLAVKGYFYFHKDSNEGKKSIEARGSIS
jgi:hypothetical protein